MERSYKEKLKDITTFVFDVDGVFTDGIVQLMPDGSQVRTANVRDGYAVQLAAKKGFRIVIITGGRSQAVKERFLGLGVEDIFLGSKNKSEILTRYMEKHSLKKEEMCYMGDDIPDYEVMKMVGLPVCPNDAAPEIKSLSHYISDKDGGKGCVRDILEQTMKIQKKWMDDEGFVW
jgi:3-deoxy-D-manno-octulosonate 8-phosphate phosphatase (KDO 8-P phosphatase)